MRLQGFDSSNVLVVAVDAPAIFSGWYAGFVTTTPIARVAVTPPSNSDRATNGADLDVLLGAWGGCPSIGVKSAFGR